MQRRVTAHVESTITGPADIVWSVAVTADLAPTTETLTVTVGGQPIEVEELLIHGGTRLHLTRGVPSGPLALDYEAVVDGVGAQHEVELADDILFRRPSRYADSDVLAAVAQAEFAGKSGKELLDAVTLWVNTRLLYVSGSSRPTDGATQTYLMRTGVCRDFAHLVIAMLRAVNVPARLVSVYAPGLSPMDFHAVAEAAIDGTWQVVDATTMAPRTTMLRIATGRDASDTAFMTVQRGLASLDAVSVTAVVDGDLPADDPTLLTYLN